MDVSSVSSTIVGTTSSGVNPASVFSPAASAGSAAISNPGSAIATTPSSDHIAQAVSKANEAFAQKNQNLYASIETDKATGINVVKIMDKDSQQTVSQYPSKAIVEIAQALQNSSLPGQLIHEKA